MKKSDLGYTINKVISIVGAIIAIAFIVHNLLSSEWQKLNYDLFFFLVFYINYHISTIKHDLKIKTMKAETFNKIVALAEENKEYERAIEDLYLLISEAEEGNKHIFMQYSFSNSTLFCEIVKKITEYSGVIHAAHKLNEESKK